MHKLVVMLEFFIFAYLFSLLGYTLDYKVFRFNISMDNSSFMNLFKSCQLLAKHWWMKNFNSLPSNQLSRLLSSLRNSWILEKKWSLGFYLKAPSPLYSDLTPCRNSRPLGYPLSFRCKSKMWLTFALKMLQNFIFSF